MTVKELIEQLKAMNEDLPVVVANPQRYDFSEIEHMQIKSIVQFELEDESKAIIDVVCLSRNER